MREILAKMAARPGRVVRNTSVATRLSLVVLLVALVSLVITSAVGLQRGGELADGVLRAQVSSLGAARADQAERYVANLRRAAVGRAISPSTADAIADFSDAYAELNSTAPSADDEKAVASFYVDEIAPALETVRERPVNAAGLIPRAPGAIDLQAAYVAGSDEGDLLSDAGDGSRWTALHRTLHDSFDEFAIQTGIDDLYLIEPDTNTVVYSTSKSIDFATSLLNGPHSGSALALLIQSLGSDAPGGVAEVHDFTRYAPAGDEPSLFVAAPVYAGTSLAGFIAFRTGPDALSEITTNGGTWTAEGATGETYVVGGDDLMRSDARGFVEDEAAYLEAVEAVDAATEFQQRSMQTFATTTLFQPVVSDDVVSDDGEPALIETTDYLGTEVLQSRRPLDIEGLDWTMVTEIDLDEIQEPVADFARNLLIAIALFLVVITFIATRWSDRLLRPVRIVSSHLRAIRAGGDVGRLSETALPDDSPAEFIALAGDIDTMLETLAGRNADAAARTAEHRRLLRQILPPQAAQRAEAGDRDVIDLVTHASVAVVAIRGLGELMREGSSDDARALLDRFVDEADALAKQRGLERIRLTGDTYVAACGLARPHIDHVARTVAFVLDVRDLVHDLGDDGRSISMSAGVDTGPVAVGLTGGAGLVYDAWGPTVQLAADLAQTSGTDEVLVSAAARSHLPSSFVFDDDVTAIDGSGATRVAGRATDRNPAR